MSTRTDTDYALEFAEYMAKGAESLLEAINEHASALMALEEGDDDVAGTMERVRRCDHAEAALSESMRGMRSDIHEFRKRRDRAMKK